MSTAACGSLKKCRTELAAEPAGQVRYRLELGEREFSLEALLGKRLRLRRDGDIQCIYCERKTSKSFGRGYCFPCFRRLARCDLCIVRPSTCHYEQGTCREPEWAQGHCMQEHYVYLANTSGLKVGISRRANIPGRWIDQGAVQALPILGVATRQQAGILEEAIKSQGIGDSTDWRGMLRAEPPLLDLPTVRDEVLARAQQALSELRQRFGADCVRSLPASPPLQLHFPVSRYPDKVRTHNLDKSDEVEGILQGIKGQYLILDSGVFNIWRHSGYRVELSVL